MATIELPDRPSGPELAFIRKSYGVTQMQVAERMGGVNRSRIAAIEAMALPPVSVSRRYLKAAKEAFDAQAATA